MSFVRECVIECTQIHLTKITMILIMTLALVSSFMNMKNLKLGFATSRACLKCYCFLHYTNTHTLARVCTHTHFST